MHSANRVSVMRPRPSGNLHVADLQIQRHAEFPLARLLVAQHQHRQTLHREAPHHAERVGLAQDKNVSAAQDDREELQARRRDSGCDRRFRSADAGGETSAGRIPSSETRFSTPFEPTMAVLTAPASIRTPTTTTKARNASRSDKRPNEIHGQPADGIVEEIVAHRIGNDHHREKRHAGRENQAVDER